MPGRLHCLGTQDDFVVVIRITIGREPREHNDRGTNQAG